MEADASVTPTADPARCSISGRWRPPPFATPPARRCRRPRRSRRRPRPGAEPADGGDDDVPPPPAAATASASGDGAPDALQAELVEVRDGDAKGRGVFAVAPLGENVWVGDYAGEVLTQAQYLRRYPAEDAEYVLGANTDYNADAAGPARSTTRYLNHSAAHAVQYEVIRVKRQRHKRVAFWTLRAIAPGEELLFDYSATYWATAGAAR